MVQQNITTVIENSASREIERACLAAMAVFMANLLFTHYKNPYVKTFYLNLSPKCKMPDHKALSGLLLDQCYNETQKKIQQRLDRSQYLNFYTDRSDNIRKKQVVNFLVNVHKSGLKKGCYYLEQEINGSKTMDVTAQFALLYPKMLTATSSNIQKANNLTTVTCTAMQALWNTISRNLKTSHIFCILCDSHGINLFIQDILTLP